MNVTKDQHPAQARQLNPDIAYFTVEVPTGFVPGGLVERHLIGAGRIATGTTHNTWLLWCRKTPTAKYVRDIYQGRLISATANPSFTEIEPEDALDRADAARANGCWCRSI